MDVGKIHSVATRAVGSPLVGDYAIGSTVLSVRDAFEFNETGGTLQVDDETLTYTSWTTDLDNPDNPDTITLSTPTTAAHTDATPVNRLPAAKVTVALVVLDETGEGLDNVIVPQHLVPTLPDGVRAENARETVTIDEVDGGWQVISVDKDLPQLNGALMPPETIRVDETEWAQARALEIAANALAAATADTKATTAQSTADGKNTMTVSTSAPSGSTNGNGSPAVTGDIWFRRSAEIIIGQWERRGGAWVSKTLDDAVIANLNAAKITAGFIDVANRLAAASISTRQLAIGSFDNLLNDPQFKLPLSSSIGPWQATAGVSILAGGARDGVTNALLFAASSSSVGTYNLPYENIAVQGSSSFLVSMQARSDADIPAGGVTFGVRFKTTAGGSSFRTVTNASLIPANTDARVYGLITAVSNAVTASPYLNVGSSATGNVTLSEPSMTRAADGMLIVDGSIDGKTITGALIRTAASGSRLELTPFGLQAYPSSGSTPTATLTTSAGDLVLTGKLRLGDSNIVTIQGEVDGTGTNGQVRFSNTALTTDSVVSGGYNAAFSTGTIKLLTGSKSSDTRASLEVVAGDGTNWSTGTARALVTNAAEILNSVGPFAIVANGTATIVGNFYDSNTATLSAGSDGSPRIWSQAVYDRTTTSSANAFVASTGTLARSTSLKDEKLDVHDVDADPYALLQIAYREWTDRRSVERAVAGGYDDPEKRITATGAIVEEVMPHRPDLVTLNGETGQPDGLAYDRAAFAFIPLIRDLVNRIDVLEGKAPTVWPDSPAYDDSATWAAIQALAGTGPSDEEPA